MGRLDQPSDKPLLDKLGVKEGMRVAVVRLEGQSFIDQLEARGCRVIPGAPRTRCDMILVFVPHRAFLDEVLERFRLRLHPGGALWVIRPKGGPDIKEVDIIDAGKRAGLVDNKIASFSDTLSAMRLVIPVALRNSAE